MRSRLKHAFEWLLSGFATQRLASETGRSRRAVLAYHNVVPDERDVGGDRSLHIPVGRFGAHLDLIRELAEVRPLTDLVTLGPECQERAWVAITFDDAYLGALTYGLEEITARGLSATVFVSPARLGGLFWWDILAASLGPGFDAEFRNRAFTEFAGDQDAILSEFAPTLRHDSLPDFMRAATEEELTQAARNHPISVAPHGWSHRSLVDLAADELGLELTRPLRWLLDRFSAVDPYLAYPFGRHSPDVDRKAESSGYAGSFRVEGGPWLGGPPSVFAMPRSNVPRDLSARGLALRLAGVR